MTDRKRFLGGSDMNRLWAGDWYDLWAEKTGRKESEDLSDVLPVQLGKFTESFNVMWFEQQTGMTVGNRNDRITTEWGCAPMSCEIDGTVSDHQGVECKHTNAFTSMDEQLQQYMPQIQTYISVHMLEGMHMSVIFGNSKWESVYVSRNQDMIHKLKEMAHEFWTHVMGDVEPANKPAEQTDLNKIELDNMVVTDRSQDNQFVSLAADYTENKEAATKFEKAKRDLKSMVQPNEREVFCDTLIIKRDKRGSLRFTQRG